MEEQLVSICVPVFNGEKFIQKTIESIFSQTYKNIEIIVSDNASSDNTVKILRSLQIKDSRLIININEKNLGFSGNLNKLINLASSNYIALYHADDIYQPNIVETQINYLNENSEIAGCFTFANTINDNDELIKSVFFLNTRNINNNIIFDLKMYISNILKYGGSSFICPSSMIKKTVYDDIGYYNEDIKFIEDLDMYIRILKKYRIGVIAKPLMNYRVHANQGSSFYRIQKTNEISPTASYIEKIIFNDDMLVNEFMNDTNKMLAVEYLRLVKNNIISNDIYKTYFFSELSKKYYKFEVLSKYYSLQHIKNKFSFLLLRFIIQMSIFLKKFMRLQISSFNRKST